MIITTDHARSSFGIPVILDDQGNPMNYAPGVVAVRNRLRITQQQLAESCGVSVRTVQGWEQGRPIGKPGALFVMADLLHRPKAEID